MNPDTGDLHPLAAILCGYEKSGTTVLNEILRRHPQLDSGHEVGVLMADSPRDFPNLRPYYPYFQQTWKLSADEATYCCDTDNWGTFYSRARSKSPVIVDKDSLIFDKTPRYMLTLSDVMEKVPQLPCVVNVRDPRAVMHSWACWSGQRDDPGRWLEDNLEANCERYLSYARGYRSAAESGRYRIYLNRFEHMCQQPQDTVRSIFAFIGLDFSEDYLFFESEHFVYGNTVTSDYLYPYVDDFSDALCDRILAATQEFSDWHFHS